MSRASSNRCIITECYVDTCLIEVLLFADKDFVNHHKGNGKVAREMKETFADRFCVGIIDEDRKPLDYLALFVPQRQNNFLTLWKHKQLHQYIIQLRPVIEKWVLSACDDADIDLSVFNLPSDLVGLLKVSKSQSSRRDERFVKLFKEMERRKCPPVMVLKHWVEFLKTNNYTTNLELL